MKTFALFSSLAAILAPFVLTSCGDSEDPLDGTGQVQISIYGEDFIEDEIPADAVVDGWTITFDEFLVVVSDVSVSGSDPIPLTGARVFDLAEGSNGTGHLVGELSVPGGRYASLAYRIAPATAAQTGNVEQSAVDRMVTGGYSLLVSGTAVKGAETITFEWGFATDTRYDPCEVALRIDDGDTGASQITVHADHLFYDDLESDEPNVAFDLVAESDVNGDNIVTLEELAATDIQNEARYQVGSRDITHLRGFIEAQTRTIGHIDGEGHCETPE